MAVFFPDKYLKLNCMNTITVLQGHCTTWLFSQTDSSESLGNTSIQHMILNTHTDRQTHTHHHIHLGSRWKSFHHLCLMEGRQPWHQFSIFEVRAILWTLRTSTGEERAFLSAWKMPTELGFLKHWLRGPVWTCVTCSTPLHQFSSPQNGDTWFFYSQGY